jgi:undecaprenyl-diphosphatase
VVGYLAIRFFLRFVVNHSLRAFAYYRFGVAALVTALLVLL